MKVDLETHGSVVVIVPRDAITEATLADVSAATEAARAQSGGGRMVLDMGNVAFLDSAAIEHLLSFAGTASRGPLVPRLAALNETVRETLSLTETLPRFSIYDSVESAVRSYL